MDMARRESTPPEQVDAEEAAAGYISGTVVERPSTDYENTASSPRGAAPPGSQPPEEGE